MFVTYILTMHGSRIDLWNVLAYLAQKQSFATCFNLRIFFLRLKKMLGLKHFERNCFCPLAKSSPNPSYLYLT